VIGDSVFICIGLVSQGSLKEFGVTELVSDPLLNVREGGILLAGSSEDQTGVRAAEAEGV
jgi:hypothetical protein